MSSVVLLIARLMIAVMFLSSGWDALSNISGTASYFEGLGFPLPTIVALGTGVFEIVMGVLLVAGYQTTIVCVVLALFALAATWMGHYPFAFTADPGAFAHKQALVKDIAVAGGLLALALHGGGALSIDAFLARRPKPEPTPAPAPAPVEPVVTPPAPPPAV
jgi:putative oxidoreductase